MDLEKHETEHVNSHVYGYVCIYSIYYICVNIYIYTCTCTADVDVDVEVDVDSDVYV